MIEHLVLFKFNKSITLDKELRLLEKMQNFQKLIPGIAYLTAGRNITNETERQQGYTLALRITFKDQAALETYGSHPVHQEFVSSLDGVIDNIIVADYPIHG